MIKDFEMGDYPDGPNIIIKVLIRRRQKGQLVRGHTFPWEGNTQRT